MRRHTTEEPQYVSVPEAAKLCGVARNTVYSWVRQGKLPAHQTPGRTNLIRPSALVAFMKNCGLFVPPSLTELANTDMSADRPAESSSGDRERVAILVVDDSAFSRNTMARMLEEQYRVFRAETGFEALHILTLNRDIRGIVLDIRMPGQLGTETLQEIKRIRPDAFVILVTGYPDDVPKDVKSDRTVAAVIEKPFGAAQLLEAVASAIAAKGA